MKKICKIILTLILTFVFIDVYADNCEGFRSTATVKLDYSLNAGMTQNFTYDIMSLKRINNEYVITGWAFNPGINQWLGQNVYVKVAFFPKGVDPNKNESGGVIFDNVVYASPTNVECDYKGCNGNPKEPKYYDLTYWDCYRASSPDDRCLDKDKHNAIKEKRGGFSAWVDLNKLEAGKEYTLYMKLDYNVSEFVDPKYKKWFSIGMSSSNIDNDAKDFNIAGKKISITKTSMSDKIIMRTDKVRLVGKDSTYCSSIVPKNNNNFSPSGTYFKTDKEYTLNSSIEDSCRGMCEGVKKGRLPLYGVNVSSDDVTTAEKVPGSGIHFSTNIPTGVSYVSPLWFEYKAELTVKVESTRTPGDLYNEYNTCQGKEVYSVYYFLNHSANPSEIKKDLTTYSLAFEADDYILDLVGGNFETKGEGVVLVDNGEHSGDAYMSMSTYFDKYYTKSSQYDKSTRILREGNNFYVKGNGWFTGAVGNGTYNSGEYKCSNVSLDYILNNRDKLATDSRCIKKDEQWKNQYDAFNSNIYKHYDEWTRLNITPTASDGKAPIEIEKVVASGVKYGQSLRVKRNYSNNDNSILFVDNKQEYSLDAWNERKQVIASVFPAEADINLRQVAVYRWDICPKSGEPKACEDTVNPAVCKSDGSGTTASFHENVDLKTCALNPSAQSGFTLVSSEETNNYCSVACKDDIDVKLPTHKSAAAGTYFVLNQHTPEVSATRTCVTSKIDYNKYNTDLTNNSNAMINAYNEYMDYEKRLETLNAVQRENHDESITCAGNEPEDDKTYDYSYSTWYVPSQAVKASSLSGNSLFSAQSGSIGTCDMNCTDDPDNPEWVSCENTWDEFYNAVKSGYENAKDKYELAQRNYNNTINSFNKCFSWNDKAPLANGSESSFKVELSDNSNNYKFGFDPDVTFNYPDEDKMKAFGAGKNEEYKYTIKDEESSTKTYYWSTSDGEPNAKYDTSQDPYKTTIGGTGPNLKNTNYTKCSGGSCTSVEGKVYSMTSYIKRVETVKRTYHLPTVYSIIPSGVVSSSKPSKPHIVLEKDAVPVNINTLEGNYDYIIKISNVEDETRKKSNQKGRKLEEAFGKSSAIKGKNLKSSDGYKCDYDVINDIYIPDDPGDPDNPKGRLNFFYRPVDTLDISHPRDNPLGYNWSSAKGTKVQEKIKKDAEDYQELISEDNGKFTFRLTPVVMKQVRYYNATMSDEAGSAFADFNLSCRDNDSSYHCYSPFLSCLASKGTNADGKTTEVASCDRIFGNTLANYEDTFLKLENARKALIKKQGEYDEG